MGFLSSLFGRRSASRPSGLSGPVRQMLTTQRANTERCISILTPCRTKEDILKAFGKAAELLRQTGDPLAQALQQAATVGSVFQSQIFSV